MSQAEARCVLTSDISSKIPVQTFTSSPSGARSGALSGASAGEREREGQLCGGERKRKRVRGNGGEREIANAACTWACSRAYQMVVVRRWKKVGRLRERRRRPKASRIPPGTVPKYRTELARPHCRIRLSACQVYSASHLENVHSGSECLVVDFAARERVSISTIVTLSEESPQPYIIDLENRFPALGTKSTFTC